MDNAKDEIDIFFVFIRRLFAEVLQTETALHTSIVRLCVVYVLYLWWEESTISETVFLDR